MQWVGRRPGEFTGLAGLDWARTDGGGIFFLLLALYSLGRIWALGILLIAVASFFSPNSRRLRVNLQGAWPHAKRTGLARARERCVDILGLQLEGSLLLCCQYDRVHPDMSRDVSKARKKRPSSFLIPLDPTYYIPPPPSRPNPPPKSQHSCPTPIQSSISTPSPRIRCVPFKPHRNEHVTCPGGTVNVQNTPVARPPLLASLRG